MLDVADNVNARVRIISDSYDDPGVQAALVDECRRDIVFFFKFFLWTYNPKVPPYHFPFEPFPHQATVIRWIHQDILDGKSNLCEKSRDWGATYLYLGVFLYHLLFLEFEGLLLSIRQEEVDNVTPSSLFGKLRYMVQRLPHWLQPLDWSFIRDGKKFLRMINPDNGNSIVGQATTEDAGRSGRKSATLIDEYAAIRNRVAEGMERSLRHVTDCIFRLSTPRGVNLFKNIRDRQLCRIITCHWTQDPRKCDGLYYYSADGTKVPVNTLPYDRRSPYGYYINTRGNVTEYRLRSAWYDKEEREAITRRDLAQEVDIGYIGSGYCRFDSEMLEEKSKQVRTGDKGRLVERDGKIKFVPARDNEDFELEVWAYPEKMDFYNRSVIGVDTAEGLEHGDFCSADVIMRNLRGDHGSLAASLHGHWRPDDYAKKLDTLGRWYDSGAKMLIERNKDGLGIILKLRNDLRYSKLIHEDEETDKLGFYTTDVKKALYTEALDQALIDGELDVYSLNHFTEMSQFENMNGKLGATGSNNDDRVISLCLAWWLARQLGKPTAKGVARKGIKRYSRIPRNAP